MAESLKEKTAKGLFWGAMNSGSTQVLNLSLIHICIGTVVGLRTADAIELQMQFQSLLLAQDLHLSEMCIRDRSM